MIPPILHIVWVGPKPPPTAMMETWGKHHPGWEVRVWRDHTKTDKGVPWECQKQIDQQAPHWPGVADIMRYQILRDHGGVAVDADERCLRPINPLWREFDCVLSFENEELYPSLVACGFMAAVPGHKLFADCVERLRRTLNAGGPSHIATGPYFISEMTVRFCKRNPAAAHPMILPARCYYPLHYSGHRPSGTFAPYGEQEWGSTRGRGYQRLRAQSRDPLVIITTGGPSVIPYLAKCMASVAMQTTDCKQVLLLDSDEACAKARELARLFSTDAIRHEFEVIRTKEWSFIEALKYIKRLPAKTICPWLDGDDWLATAEAAEILREEYADEDCWMTYGSFRWYPRLPDGGFNAMAYSPAIVERNMFREDGWRATHWRSSRAGLVHRLHLEDMFDKTGRRFIPCDVAYTWPLLEMSGAHAKFIDKMLYVYNAANVESYNHLHNRDEPRREQQRKDAETLRAMPKYSPLTERPW